jgi:uncharacterized membrane protein YdbT with pleckstrin-like domain
MTYVRRVMQPGETLVHTTRLHPVIFFPAAAWAALAVVLLAAGIAYDGDLRTVLAILAGIAALWAAKSAAVAGLRRFMTELAVTDRRVIYKTGLIARHTLEMNRGKVESVDVEQSVWGRILGFGTIIVRGTGGSLEPIRLIDDPLTFRSHITAG